jgi:hypothetical protein
MEGEIPKGNGGAKGVRGSGASPRKEGQKEKVVDKSGRISGFKFFEKKSFDFEAMELACENAQRDEEEEVGEHVNEELFDMDDDDLDDFDDDDDDEEEQSDI